METKIKLSAKQKIWNDAVIATLREVAYYDGVIKLEDRQMLIPAVFNKLKKGKIEHTFRILY